MTSVEAVPRKGSGSSAIPVMGEQPMIASPMELLDDVVRPFLGTIANPRVSAALPDMAATIPEVATTTTSPGVSATPAEMPNLTMTPEIIEQVERKLELEARVIQRVRTLYLSQNEPLPTETEYRILTSGIINE